MHDIIDFSPIPAERSAPSSLRTDGRHAASRRRVTVVRQIRDGSREAPNHWRCFLDRYLDGWAEADIDKVVAATASDYRFDDPLVGRFSRQSLPAYFETLKAQFARAGLVDPRDFVFILHGPVDAAHCNGRREYFREAPRLGLTGVASIVIGERGIAAERVSYDLNLASDVLRRVP